MPCLYMCTCVCHTRVWFGYFLQSVFFSSYMEQLVVKVSTSALFQMCHLDTLEVIITQALRNLRHVYIVLCLCLHVYYYVIKFATVYKPPHSCIQKSRVRIPARSQIFCFPHVYHVMYNLTSIIRTPLANSKTFNVQISKKLA